MRRRRLPISLIIAAISLLIITGVVWAAYEGPNRTVSTSEWLRRRCYYEARYSGERCEATIYYTPGTTCPAAADLAGIFNPSYCGAGWLWTCTSVPCSYTRDGRLEDCTPSQPHCREVSSTTTLDPATASANFTCGSWGPPGPPQWCAGGAAIDFSANEPISPEVITYIETYSGTLCDPEDAPTVSCTWAGGGEGAQTIDYWAHSTYGDTSEMRSVTWRLDTVPPTAGANVSGGTAGGGGWYRGGPLTVSGGGSDYSPGSGIASSEVSIGGGPYAGSAEISSEGWYNVDIITTDNAGHTSTGSTGIGLDNTPPTIHLDINGTAGNGSWYTSATVTGTESGSDALSGIGSRQYQIDGEAWQSGGSAAVTGEGAHTVNWQVTDVAGNTSTGSQSFSIDSVEPVSVFVSPPEGSTVTVNGMLNMDGTSADATSGLDVAQISLNGGTSWSPLGMTGGAWNYAWDTSTVPNGRYTVLVRASDVAGNLESTAQITVVVDNEGPRVNITDLWMVWETASVSVHDSGIGIRNARLVIDGGDFGNRRFDWSSSNIPSRFTWDRYFGSVLAPPGEYQVTLIAWDDLGNEGSDRGVIVVPEPPTATPTLEPTATATHTSEPARRAASATPMQLAMAPAEPVDGEPPAPEPKHLPPASYIWWPLLVIVGAAVVLGFTGTMDPRPPAWKRLANVAETNLEANNMNKGGKKWTQQ